MASEHGVIALISNAQGDEEIPSEIKEQRNLLAAVMIRAICDAFGRTHVEKHIVRAARQWLFGELTPKRPFSFAWIAINLDFDPKQLRDLLEKEAAAGDESMEKRISILRS